MEYVDFRQRDWRFPCNEFGRAILLLVCLLVSFVAVADGAPPLQTIRFQGFEGSSNDTWAFDAFPGRGRIAVRGDDHLALGQTGVYALKLSGSDALSVAPSNPYVVFDRVDLAGYTGVTFSVGFACRGVDSNDDLWVDLSFDDGESWPISTNLVSGLGNLNLDFGDTNAARTVETNPWGTTIDDAHGSLRVRVRFEEASGATNLFDHYYVDNLLVEGYGAWPVVYFGQTEILATEGDEDILIPVHITGSADATVRVAVAGTALPGGVDFSLFSTTLVFSAGGPATAYLEVDVVRDYVPEGPEWARLTLVQPEGVRVGGPDGATLFIRDNDSLSIVAANLPAGPELAYVEEANRQLRLLCPDVVAIQEWLLPGGSTDFRGFVDEHFGTAFSYSIEDASLPNGVISRWPIVAAGEWDQPEMVNRDFAWASIELPDGKLLHVVSVHFKAGSETTDRDRRIAEARALTNYVAQAGFAPEDYLVIAGDLNLAGRNEETIQILGTIVSDAYKPSDQFGEQRTSMNRNYHYDFVLPSPLLEEAHLAYEFNGFVFTNGMVFDSRVWDLHQLPVLVDDSGAVNMQHMAVMKVFALDAAIPPPGNPRSDLTAMHHFIAAWDEVEDAGGYTLQVATTSNFAGSGGGGSVYSVDFEDGNKGSYATGEVTLGGLPWTFNEALIGTSASDRKNGLQSARVRSSDPAGIIAMNADTNMGLSSITFLHAKYGTDADTSGRVEYSTNSGSSWVQAGTFDVASTNLTPFEATNINVAGSVRVRMVKTSGGTAARYNIDEVKLYPYGAADSFVPGYSSFFFREHKRRGDGIDTGRDVLFPRPVGWRGAG